MTTDLLDFGDGDQALRVGKFRLRRMGLTVNGTPTFDEWQACGVSLIRIAGAVQFWIGDWINIGKAAYGDKYAEGVEQTGIEQHTLENYAFVAGNVQFSRRRENLSFSVHSEVAGLPAKQQEKILNRAVAEDLNVRAVRDLVRALAHADKVARIERGDLPSGEYDIVCADPPWSYSNTGFEQSAAEHYPTMAVEDIATLPQTDATFPRFADPCVLFLWATSPLVPEATVVMQAWGFVYKACLVWVKDRAPGLGWWLNTRHELLLVGARGSSLPVEKVDSVIEAGVDAHSRKPVEAYQAIDRMFPPGLRRVECFAREARPGWDRWGQEA